MKRSVWIVILVVVLAGFAGIQQYSSWSLSKPKSEGQPEEASDGQGGGRRQARSGSGRSQGQSGRPAAVGGGPQTGRGKLEARYVAAAKFARASPALCRVGQETICISGAV